MIVGRLGVELMGIPVKFGQMKELAPEAKAQLSLRTGRLRLIAENNV